MEEVTAQPNIQAPAPEYSEDGVDLTLIRWMLSLTPLERLRYLNRHNRSILKLRAAVAAGTRL